MTIERFGLQLQSLKECDLELVRNWRNSKWINENLIHRDYITSEQQLCWYESLQNEQNAYFIISFRGEKTGLIYLTNINWGDLTFEANLFIGNEKYIESFVPVYAAIILSDLFFFKLHFRKAYSKHFIENNRSAHFDSALGFNYAPQKLENASLAYNFATPESYSSATLRLRNSIHRNNPQGKKCVIHLDQLSVQGRIEEKIIQHISKLKQQEIKLAGNLMEILFHEFD